MLTGRKIRAELTNDIERVTRRWKEADERDALCHEWSVARAYERATILNVRKGAMREDRAIR